MILLNSASQVARIIVVTTAPSYVWSFNILLTENGGKLLLYQKKLLFSKRSYKISVAVGQFISYMSQSMKTV
jgi:hypothetical protein